MLSIRGEVLSIRPDALPPERFPGSLLDVAQQLRTRVRLTRPTLALWRSPGVLQVGLDSPALVLEGVPRGLADAVPLLTQPCTTDELGALLPHLDHRWLDWLVSRLDDAGLIAPTDPAPRPALVVVGAGALAEAVATALGTAGLRPAQLDPVEFAASPPAEADSELVVLAGPAVEPDRSVTDDLFRSGRTHLVVRLEPDRAVVGPLVHPGRTPCVRCQDLSRVHLDPAWPHLLAQLCREPVEAPPALREWAATTASVQVQAWLGGGTPEACGGSLELTLPDYRLRTRPWPAHPGCGCVLPPG